MKRILIVSDLHLGPNSAEPGPAVARFLERLATPDWLPVKLILLGDTFDLCRAEEEVSGSPADRRQRRLARLDSILDRHRILETSLACLTRLGVDVVVVLGNHDLPLADPALAARLRERLGGAETSLRMAPRYVLVPGVLFAEHGNQYHDINAIRGRPIDSRGRLRLPLAAYAEAAARVVRPQTSDGISDTRLVARAATLARLARGAVTEMTRRPLVRARRRGTAVRIVRSTAGVAGTEPPDSPARLGSPELDANGLARLDEPGALEGLDQLPVLPMLGRLLRTALTRRGSGGGPRPSVASIDALLRSAGERVPLLVFAHTHVTDARAVPGTEGVVTWFNSGSWREPHDAMYPFVAVDLNGGAGPSGRVLWWNDLNGAIEDRADVSPTGQAAESATESFASS